MEATLSPWGNSIGLRIPKIFADMVGFYRNQKIILSVEDNKIIITPQKKKTLSEIIQKIPNDYSPHLEWENTKPLGKEVW